MKLNSSFIKTAVMLLSIAFTESVSAQTLNLQLLGSYKSGSYDLGAAEIVAHDPATQRLFIVNGANKRIDVLDISNPQLPVALTPIDILPYGAAANSVAIRNGIVAVAVEASPKTDSGKVVFFNTSGAFQNQVTVGALPDMLTFTPDGLRVLTANEGEPDNYTSAANNDPEGSVSIVNISGGVANATVQTVRFNDFNFGGTRRNEIDTTQVRVFGPFATVAEDLEPEYITVVGDTAYVGLQENNAIARITISNASVVDIRPLGSKDYSLAGNGADFSDRDVNGTSGGGGKINIINRPVRGLYMPDAIASYTVGGQSFILSANEGDVRDISAGYDEAARVSTLTLDPAIFPTATDLKTDSALGRLTVSKASGLFGGDYDTLFTFGTRSFSIWNTGITRIFDSGDRFEQVTAAQFPTRFNASSTNNNLDSRSASKGPEPEAVTTGVIDGRTFAFIGCERIGGIFVYDVTTPATATFVQYINARNFGVTPAAGTVNAVGDLAPEGIIFVAAAQSPNGKPLIILANETSGTVSLYQVNANAAPPASVLKPVGGAGTFSFDEGGVETGVDITLTGVTGTGNISVTRYNEPALNFTLASPPANLSQYRWAITQTGLSGITATVKFVRTQIPNAGITNLNTVTVYSRNTIGTGVGDGAFTALTTTVSGDTLLAEVTGFSEFIFGSNDAANVLPVELTSFVAEAKDGVTLKWTTASEKNNAGFEVERTAASNPAAWEKIGFVKGNGTTSETQAYSFNDSRASGKLQYRLKQIDLDGTVSYSQTVEFTVGVPAKFALSQNYPNPFNPSTAIRYDLARTSEVSLKIYDMLGREVSTLVRASQEAGRYSVSFNASTLASGLYFYRIQAGAFTETKRMMLVK